MLPVQSFGSVIFFQPNIMGLTVPFFSSAFDGVFLFPLTATEQEIITPTSTVMSPSATLKLPRIISQLLEPGGAEYYFQRDSGKLCLTRINYPPHTPSGIWSSAKQKFSDAVASWKALSEPQKEFYRIDPRRFPKNISGRSLYISLYIKGALWSKRFYPFHPPPI